jgi:hypothetical protein
MKRNIHFKAHNGDKERLLDFGVLKKTLLVSNFNGWKSSHGPPCDGCRKTKPFPDYVASDLTIIQEKSLERLPAAAFERIAQRFHRYAWTGPLHTPMQRIFDARTSGDAPRTRTLNHVKERPPRLFFATPPCAANYILLKPGVQLREHASLRPSDLFGPALCRYWKDDNGQGLIKRRYLFTKITEKA